MNAQVSTLKPSMPAVNRHPLLSHTRVIMTGESAASICLLNPGNSRFPVLVDSAGEEIRYIHDDAFLSHSTHREILQAPKKTIRKTTRKTHTPSKMGSYLAHLWAVPLLSRDEEVHHFRKLHFLRFKSAKLQVELSTCRGHIDMLREAEANLKQAAAARALLIESNLRLVVSLAKKYTRANLTLDELVSVGNTALVNAVDQFDYRRGCRFSTYAYQAIQRAIFSALRAEYRKRDRFYSEGHEATENLTKDASYSDLAELHAAEAREQAQKLLDLLDPRERIIVATRFGILEGTEPSSFQKIAVKIGLSKQRVASIFSSAMSKIRQALSHREDC